MPKTIAIIPARGGSQRVPRKNLYELDGLPLIVHSIRHAQAADQVGEVFVSTDDSAIARVSEDAGATVINRPSNLATETCSSEAALLQVLDARSGADPDLVVFLQCTSPVRSADDIDSAIRQFLEEGADSMFSACRDNGLFWRMTPAGPQPQNYEITGRQREQEMAPQYRENGSIYIFRPRILRRDGVRLGGRISIFEMSEFASHQIDTAADVKLVEWLLSEIPRSISWPDPLGLVVFDFDGVMTDNTVLVQEDGTETVRVHRGDGWGVSRLTELNIPLAVLSTEANPVVAARCAKLGIKVVQGVTDKAAGLVELLEHFDVRAESVAFVGNDVNDLPALLSVGLPVVVSDAHAEARRVAELVLSRPGGQGAVREFCDLLLDHLESKNR